MKKKSIKYYLFFFFLVIVYTTNLSSIENKIVLKIDNKIITNIDVDDEANYLTALNPKLKELSNNKILEVAKASLIREKIKEIEILKLNIEKINDEYLEILINSIYQKIGLNNRNEFLNYIKSFNINISTIKKKLSYEAQWNQIIYAKFFSRIKIDEKKIETALKLNKETSKSYFLYEIVYNAEKKVEAEQLFEKIKVSISTNGFENTASIYSISESSKVGGKLGWISENSVAKKILEKISNIKKGDYTDPILIPGGFLILSVQDIKETKKEIDIKKELATRIRSLQNQQLNQYSNIYFNKIKKDVVIDEK